MVKYHLALLLLAFGISANAEPQLWALTFPEKHRDYYLDKFREGDEKAIASISSNLERLIEDGTLTEFERINHREDGKIFPFREPIEQNLFSTYKLKGKDPMARVFYLSRPSPGKRLTVTLYGELGKLWTPSAYLKEDDLDVLILERDPEAEENFVPPAFESRFDVESPYEATYLWMTSVHPEELKKRSQKPEEFYFYCLHRYALRDPKDVSITIGSDVSFTPLGNNKWNGCPQMSLAHKKGNRFTIDEYYSIQNQRNFQGEEYKSQFSFVERVYELPTLTFLEGTAENPKKRGKWTALMRSLKD